MVNDPFPLLGEIILVFDQLIAEVISRSEASVWATPFFLNDDVRVDDDRIRNALEYLYIADAISTDRPFLYGIEDFREWREEISR